MFGKAFFGQNYFGGAYFGNRGWTPGHGSKERTETKVIEEKTAKKAIIVDRSPVENPFIEQVVHVDPPIQTPVDARISQGLMREETKTPPVVDKDIVRMIALAEALEDY